MSVCVDFVLSNLHSSFVTKPGKVMHHNDMGCGAKKKKLILKRVVVFKVTLSECLCDGNVTVSTRASELMIFWQPNIL